MKLKSDVQIYKDRPFKLMIFPAGTEFVSKPHTVSVFLECEAPVTSPDRSQWSYKDYHFKVMVEDFFFSKSTKVFENIFSKFSKSCQFR